MPGMIQGRSNKMTSATSNPVDAHELSQKLNNAERKYYSNLKLLEEKLARLEAFQTLSKRLIACTDPSEVLDKLVELSIQYTGVEKAAVIQSGQEGYRIAALKGYSRTRAGELQRLVISGSNNHLQKVSADTHRIRRPGSGL